MPIVRVPIIGGLNTYVNPIGRKDGDLLRSVNVETYPYGAKRKRPGYKTFLGTADGSAVTDLFSFESEAGNLFVYRVSGGKLYYSVEGTGAWSVAGNGTVSGQHVGHAVLDDTLIIGDGAGSTRHTTNGTSFTNTTLAPVGEFFAQYKGRVYIGGTTDTLFYSSSNDATDWSTSSPSDSSSLKIPGAGKMAGIFVVADRLVATKSSGLMFRWDEYNLVDLATNKGPTSPYSIADHEGYKFYINDDGINGYGGLRPELISNPVSAQMNNAAGSGVTAAVLGTAPGEVYRDSYYCAIGTVTDDVVNETINNCVIKYDFRRNDFTNLTFNDYPTCFHTFNNTSGKETMIFGTDSGQVMEIDGTLNADDGSTIPTLMEFALTLGGIEVTKEWRKLWMFFNPGNQAKVQVAFSDTYARDSLKWIDIGDAPTGTLEKRLPINSRSKIMFVRVYETSKNARFNFYGMSVEVDAVPEHK